MFHPFLLDFTAFRKDFSQMFPETYGIDWNRIDGILQSGDGCVVVFTSGATVPVSKAMGDHLVKTWVERRGAPVSAAK